MPEAAGKPIRLIVGLGNPGNAYERTRHNAGFDFCDEVARKFDARFSSSSRFPGDCARINAKGGDVWILKPTTYMNESGRAVQPFAAYYKIAPDEILVVHDELDIAPGTMKLRRGGGSAGHNGLKSITSCLGSPDYWRLRLGIGHPRALCPGQEVYDWVLGRPAPEHRAGIDECIAAAAGAVDALSCGAFDRAQRTITRHGTKAAKKAKPPQEKTGKDSGASAQ